MTRTLRVWSSCGVLAAVALLALPAAGQEGFRDLTMPEAGREANERNLPVLANVTARWARDARRMEREIWPDERLQSLIADRVVAVRIDADTQPAVAQQLRVLAYPTLILIGPDGVQVGRPLVGFRDAAGVLAWLREGLGIEGEVEETTVEAPSAARLPATLQAALSRVSEGRDEEAGQFLRWLWSNMEVADPGSLAIRRTVIASAIGTVAGRHEPTRAYFEQQLASVEQRLRDGGSDWRDLRDWVALSAALGREDAVIDWVRGRVETPEGLSVVRRLSTELAFILLDERELDLLDAVVPDGVGWSRRAYEWSTVFRLANLRGLRERLDAERLRVIGAMYGSLLARGHDGEADDLYRWFVVAHPDQLAARRTLVNAAIEWGEAREGHVRWIMLLPEPERPALLEAVEAQVAGRASAG